MECNSSSPLLPPLLGSLSPQERGALVVVTDMSLAVLSVVMNLVVLTAIREKDSRVVGVTSLLLANLCLANLTSAALVKSISIVHNGYAVAANSTQSNIAFCSLHVAGYRGTWSVLPWTVLILSWVHMYTQIHSRVAREPERLVAGPSLVTSPSPSPSSRLMYTSEGPGVTRSPSPRPQGEEGDESSLQLSLLEKSLLGVVWAASLLYCCCSDQLVNPPGHCTIRESPTSTLGITSIVLVLLLPLLLGPLLLLLLQLLLPLLSCIYSFDCTSSRRGDLLCIFLLTTVFTCTYTVNMVLVEVYFESLGSILSYVLLKYCLGTTHHFLSPLAIFLSYPEVRAAAGRVFSRGGTVQAESKGITMDQLKKELGMDVRNCDV